MGEIKIFAGTFAPNGWYFCDGTFFQFRKTRIIFIIGHQLMVAMACKLLLYLTFAAVRLSTQVTGREETYQNTNLGKLAVQKTLL
jgi:hypothetical protein